MKKVHTIRSTSSPNGDSRGGQVPSRAFPGSNLTVSGRRDWRRVYPDFSTAPTHRVTALSNVRTITELGHQNHGKVTQEYGKGSADV